MTSYVHTTNEHLMSLLEFVLSKSYIVFEELLNHQVFVCVQGSLLRAVIAELIIFKWSLRAHNVETVFKPHQTLSSVFRTPKHTLEHQMKDSLHLCKGKCANCTFAYIGERKRSGSCPVE